MSYKSATRLSYELPRERGRCSVCFRRVDIKKDGTAGAHYTDRLGHLCGGFNVAALRVKPEATS